MKERGGEEHTIALRGEQTWQTTNVFCPRNLKQ